MRNEAIATGRTVDAAIEAACAQLGLEREDVEIDVLELPHKGFLGFTHIPAKVKAFVELPDPPAAPIEKPAVVAPAAPVVRPAAPAAPRFAESRAAAATPAAPVEPADGDKTDSKEFFAAEYVRDIVRAMGLSEATVSADRQEQNLLLTIDGDASGVAIGRRGETLDALQYLAGLSANRMEGDYVRVVLDSGNYRDKRHHTLEQLAKKLAAAAIKTGRSTTLEPMNPYERRIIHATVAEMEGVTSTSVGEEPNRCVVISSTNPRPQQAVRPGTEGRAPRREGGYAPRTESRPSRPYTPREARPAVRQPAAELPREESPAPRQEPVSAPRQEPVSAPRQEPVPAPRQEPVPAPRQEPVPAPREEFVPAPREESRPFRRQEDRPFRRDDRRGGPRREKPEPYQTTGEREVAPSEGADTPLYGKIEL